MLTQQQQLFYGPMSGTTRVSRYQKKHSPTHHPDHHPVFVSCSINIISSSMVCLMYYKITKHYITSCTWFNNGFSFPDETFKWVKPKFQTSLQHEEKSHWCNKNNVVTRGRLTTGESYVVGCVDGGDGTHCFGTAPAQSPCTQTPHPAHNSDNMAIDDSRQFSGATWWIKAKNLLRCRLQARICIPPIMRQELIRRWDSERELLRSASRKLPKFAEITQNNAITPFKVIQGDRFWYQLKAHIRFPVSD